MNVQLPTFSTRRSMVALVAMILMALSVSLRAEDAWRKDAEKIGLLPEDVGLLASNKVVVTRETYRQVFTPYLGPQLPVFVTSDSLLNGFHVLFQESVTRIEMGNAAHLPRILSSLWKHLEEINGDGGGNKELFTSAKRRAQIVLGVALRLAGDESCKIEGEVGQVVGEEVALVIEAKAVQKSKWLGPPDRSFMALDYSRYKPRGFYDGKESLQRYFRAVSWLQSIPFRVDKDEELMTICLLMKSKERNWEEREALDHVFGFYREFLGSGDDWDLTSSNAWLPDDMDSAKLMEIRKDLHKSASEAPHRSRINDQVRYAPDAPDVVAELQFRLMSAARLPDAVMFQQTTDLQRFPRRELPTGLEVCAAFGSERARMLLTKRDDTALLQAVEAGRSEFAGKSLYHEYLRCLSALTEPPPEDAPAFMKQEAWQLKSLQTVLGGWSQMRHTWALQAKQNVVWMCAVIGKPVGFVEPNPEFFSRVALLTERTGRIMQKREVFGTNMLTLAEELKAVRVVVNKQDALFKRGENWRPDTEPFDDESRIYRAHLLLSAWEINIPMLDLWIDDSEIPKPTAAELAKIRADADRRIGELAHQLEMGQWPEDAKLSKALMEIQSEIDVRLDFSKLWERLARLCRRLEVLANKQLRPAAFSEEEQKFLLRYGEELGGIMLYGGNTYISHPHDDSPRVVDVASNLNTKKYLEVGVGRPRALYVLYPWQGDEILCRGAVLPYYEFAHPSRLTDAEWKTLLDSDKCPPQPEWVKPICGLTKKPKDQ